MPALIQLKFITEKPVEEVQGSHLHALFFNLLPSDVAERVHAMDKKPFSIWLESLQEKEISLIASLLEDELLPSVVYGYYMQCRDIHIKGTPLKPKKPQGLREIKSETYEELLQGKLYRRVNYEFLTPCTFNRYRRDYPLPDPQLVFEGLLKRWNAFSERALPEDEIRKRILREVSMAELQISTQTVELSEGVKVRGFVGRVSFLFHSEEVSTLLSPLVRFSVYSGVGRKTAMGLGRVMLGFKKGLT